MSAYFEPLGEGAYRPTEHVGGAWSIDEQHIAPSLGLLAHLVEQDCDRRRGERLALGRLSFDILGTVPVEPVQTSVSVLRPGRTVELVEATMSHAGRAVVRARAWLLQRYDTTAIAGTPVEPVPGPDELEPWDPTTVWPGGFIASLELRRRRFGPGDSVFWARTPLELVAGEEVSARARAVGLLDIANGMSVRADPRSVAFPNLDLTAHLYAEPAGDWLGFRTRVSFGPDGLGLTSTELHGAAGPFGTVAQSLTVRPG